MGWCDYADVGRVYEISAVYDDRLKKDNTFINYAVMVANRICVEKGLKCQVTWGKWGGRIEPLVNPHLTEKDIELIANVIVRHPSWTALLLSTWVFTFAEYNEEVADYQATNPNKGQNVPLEEIIKDMEDKAEKNSSNVTEKKSEKESDSGAAIGESAGKSLGSPEISPNSPPMNCVERNEVNK